ncbi:MAG: hypothetical protein AB1757_14900 [Acidobacteriota bacterium]
MFQHTKLYEICNGEIEGPEGLICGAINWQVQNRATTVILGPGGTGKSSLLKALSGETVKLRWKLWGDWYYKSIDFQQMPLNHLLTCDIFRLRQLKSANFVATPSLTGQFQRNWDSVFQSGAKTLLLDEPTVGETAESIAELVNRINHHKTQGAAVVVTHHLDFARSIADDVAFLYGKHLLISADADTFFNHPPNELIARFLEQGNCSYPPPNPPLPSHFNWLIRHQLAGMGRPGLLGDADEDLTAIAQSGIKLVVSLTEEPFPLPQLKSFGMRGRHFPIKDMGIPAISPAARLCRDIEKVIANGEGVALHCQAGMGRTGTMLAAYLVWIGYAPEKAIEQVRSVARGYIQNRSQEAFIRRFAEQTSTQGRKQL